MSDRSLTAERLRTLFHYDERSGVFTRRVAGGRWGSLPAGSVPGRGIRKSRYPSLLVDGKRYYLHRLAWLYVRGEWPILEIDHINGVRTDNRFHNLREATRQQNSTNVQRKKNNTSGFKGVHFDRQRSKWIAKIQLGSFATATEAHAAYCRAAELLHGQFARAS